MSSAGMHRCPRCHFQTFDFEALCRVCGWDQWDGGHAHGWWYSWVEITGWLDRHEPGAGGATA